MSVLAATARPWGPFVVGFTVGVALNVYAVIHAVYLRPPSLQQPWEYDDGLETYIARWRHDDWRYSVFAAIPFVLGVVVWLVWFILSIAAGVGGGV